MQFGFMSCKSTIDSVITLSRILVEYLAKLRKFYMCLIDLEKTFHIDLKKVVELEIRKSGIPKSLASLVKSLYKAQRQKCKLEHIYLKRLR